MATFFRLVIKETLSSLVKYYIDLSKENNKSTAGRVGSLFHQYTPFKLGRDPKHARKKEALMNRFLTGSDEIDKWSGEEEIIPLDKYPVEESDGENVSMYNRNLKKYLFDPLDAYFQANAKDLANEGQTPELRGLAYQKVNDVYRLCQELGLENLEYDEKNAMHRFAYIALCYLNVRDGSDQTVAKSKCDLVRKSYAGLKKTIASLREDPEPGVYEDTVLREIKDLMAKHDELRDQAAVGVDLPLNVSIFTIAQAKLKVTPGAGELGDLLTELSKAVNALRTEKVEAAERRVAVLS